MLLKGRHNQNQMDTIGSVFPLLYSHEASTLIFLCPCNHSWYLCTAELQSCSPGGPGVSFRDEDTGRHQQTSRPAGLRLPDRLVLAWLARMMPKWNLFHGNVASFTAGVIDDRGKFISITPQELDSVAQFIRQRGRVSITELAQASNSLINLTPESRSAAWYKPKKKPAFMRLDWTYINLAAICWWHFCNMFIFLLECWNISVTMMSEELCKKKCGKSKKILIYLSSLKIFFFLLCSHKGGKTVK